jgi:hypothetical protein
MDDQLKLKLQMDSAHGEEYQRAWDSLIEPFFENKKKDLYEAFTDMGSTDADALMLIKMQANALESLKDEFQHHINTGKLARKAIEEEEANG